LKLLAVPPIKVEPRELLDQASAEVVLLLRRENLREGKGNARRSPKSQRTAYRLLALMPLDFISEALRLPTAKSGTGRIGATGVEAAILRTNANNLRELVASNEKNQCLELVGRKVAKRVFGRSFRGNGHSLER